MKQTDTIPADVIGQGDGEIEVAFEWTPGQGPSGQFGPPEHYDPGSPDEYEDITATLDGVPLALTGDDEEKIADWLAEHWEPPEPDYFEDSWEPDFDKGFTGID